MGVGSLQEIEEFNDQTEENEAYIQVQAASADEIMDTSEIEQDEQRQLNRDLENNIIIRFRFHPDNYYEKQNGKRGIFEIHLLRIRKDIFVQKRERYFENSLDLL